MHEEKDQEVEIKDTSWIKSEDRRSTVLEMVLSTLCPYHKRLLYCILKFIHEDNTVSLGLRDLRCLTPSSSECRCSHDGRKLCEDGRSIACHLQSSQLTENSDTSVCDCVKNPHSPACPSVSLSCIKKVCTTSSVCHCHQETMSCTHHTCKDQPCAMHIKTMESITTQTPHQPPYLNTDDCCRSPSPPPLSPMPLDTDLKITESHSANQSSECKPHCMHPPWLEEETDEFACLKVEADQKVGCTIDGKQDGLNVKGKKPLDEQGSLVGDFMDRITEKLESITEEKKCVLPDSPSSDSKDDIHFKEIITKVLHSSNENDYDLNKLLQQHEGDANKSPQTRSRSRQEMLTAMSRSPDQPSIRRQNLQIKMDIARLAPHAYKKRLGKQKKKIENKESESLPQLNIEGQFPVSVDVQVSKVSDQQKCESPRAQDGQEKDNCDHTMENGRQEGGRSIRSTETVLPKNTRKCVPLVDTVETTRARRNIVPPQRFSSYVTEPRKMYFAACFSENIFIQRTPKENALKDTTTTEVIDTSAEMTNQKVPKHDTGVCPNEKLSSDQTSMDVDTTTAAAPCPKQKETNQSCFQQIPEEQDSPQKDNSQVGDLAINTDEQLIDCQDCPSELHYSSPIKLMFVSPVIGEEGLRYVLKSASSNLSKGEEFDPCESSSWGRPDEATKNTEGIIPQNSSPKPVENEQDENSLSQNVLASNKEGLFVPESNEVHIRDVSPVKRRPGRPKKLGPQIPKPAKRPIGRPPKHKIVDPAGGSSTENDTSVKDKAPDASCGDDGSSKNLKITVVYGRSRRSRRLVSESREQTDSVNEAKCQRKRSEPCTINIPVDDVGNNGTAADSLSETPKEQMENLNFVRPVKERKCAPNSKSHIKCQKRNETGAIRKPGRPPKVKISGISVTVTTVSPRQRKIRMNREMKDSPPRRRYLLPQFNKHTESNEPKNIMDEQRKEISDQSDQERIDVKTPEVAVRHSVRERKPSIYLLHSVATSRSFSHSNALLRRSRQVLLNKANSEHKKLDDFKGTSKKALSINHTVKTVGNMKGLSQFSDISVDSIFTSSEPLKWWSTSASPKTLNEESDRRIKLISNTWISGITENDRGDLKPLISSKANCSKTTPVSAVKMLFDKHYNMDNLCSWFMQTTETQSLAIVKKASAKNPYEIMHSNPFRVFNRTNVCPSRQSESLRKPVKKFAKVVPKTPKMYQHARVIMCNSIQANHISLKRSQGKMSAGTQSGCLKTWEKYRNTLQRVRSKFDSKISQRGRRKTLSDVNTESEVSLVSNLSQTTVDQGSVPPQKIDTLTTSTLTDERTNSSGALTKEERISSKAWSAESLKECRVFLKKINSPDNKLTAEECNICTVEPCHVMPSRYSTTAEHNKLQKVEAANGLRSPSRDLKPHSLQKEQQVSDRGVRTGKRKSFAGSESPPVKAARQSRRSRGFSTAKWSDFILGSAK